MESQRCRKRSQRKMEYLSGSSEFTILSLSQLSEIQMTCYCGALNILVKQADSERGASYINQRGRWAVLKINRELVQLYSLMNTLSGQKKGLPIERDSWRVRSCHSFGVAVSLIQDNCESEPTLLLVYSSILSVEVANASVESSNCFGGL